MQFAPAPCRKKHRLLQLLSLSVLMMGLVGMALADGLPAPDIDALRQQIKNNGWNFEVDDHFSSTITPEQRLNLRSGFSMTDADQRELEQHLKIFPLDKDPLPSSLDWRDVDGITPVKNQGSCGSCWAFAATAEMEAFIKIYYGTEMNLSEQQSISCNPYGAGCDGGWAAASYYVFQNQGAVTESCMPYLGIDPPSAPCIQSGMNKYGYITGYNYISNNVEQMKAALQNGPICTGISATDAFEAYGGGCFDEFGGWVNHLVLIVGYDDRSCGEQGAWIIKNSWGAGFGEGGYITVQYGAAATGSGVTQLEYVAPPVAINLGGGISGADLFAGETRELTWTTSGDPVDFVDIYLGVEGHCHDQLVAQDVPNTGHYTWLVPNQSTDSASLVIFPSATGTEGGFGLTNDFINILGHKTRYVSTLGSNTAPFDSPATAAHSISDALNACTGVDTILVAGGDYVGSLTLSGPINLMGGFSEDFNSRDVHNNPSRIISGNTGLRILSGCEDLGGIDGFVFEGCSAAVSSDPVGGRHGGAINISGAAPRITNCEFTNNLADPNGGLGYGGAVCVIGGAPVLTDCRFTGNAGTKGGALAAFGGAAVTLNDCEFSGNNCSDGLIENQGGAIFVQGSALTFNGGSLSGTQIAHQGGGLFAEASTISFFGVDVLDNQSTSDGGGLLVSAGSLTLEKCLVQGNRSLSGNGGGISTSGASLDLRNSRFSGNDGGNLGGGVLALGAGGTVENCLVDGNSATSGGGLAILASEDFLVRNNIILENQGNGLMVAGDLMTEDHNNIFGNQPADFDSGTPGPHDLSLDPLFVDAAGQDFGLAQYSPCVDAGQIDANCLDPDGSRADLGLLGGPAADFVAPQRVTGAVLTDLGGGQVRVAWDPAPEENIDHYVVYRDTAAVFIPNALRAVATVPVSTTSYDDAPPYDCYYLIAAVTSQGYSGGYSERVFSGDQASAVGNDQTPQVLAITGVVPNPFNPMTSIRFDVPLNGRVQLEVFDLRGRLVRELVSGSLAAGSHEVIWNGRDGSGQMSAAGVYFARISTAQGNRTTKMVLAK